MNDNQSGNEFDAHSFAQYLLAKRSVDDRALHPRLWRTFLTYLDDLEKNRSRAGAIHLLELGCGIGTMFERLWPSLQVGALLYTAIDSEHENLQHFAARITSYLSEFGYTPAPENDSGDSTTQSDMELHFEHPGANRLTFRLVCADVQGGLSDILLDLPPIMSNMTCRSFIDGVIAHAFLDLVECRPLLRDLRPALAPHAHLYLTINFDGLTLFEPEIDSQLDSRIERLYHATMDNRIIAGRRAGHSRTGRRLFHDLRAEKFDVLDVASSDWIVFPKPDGYAKQEAAFLHHILDFVEGALNKHPQLSHTELERWITIRRKQIANEELVYIAHQLDYLAQPRP